MIYPFVLMKEKSRNIKEYVPREYGIDFETGQITGRIVEGVEALKVWVWLALQTPRYRYYIYSWQYGQEYEDLVGKGYSASYVKAELKRMTEECLQVNPYITGISNFNCEKYEDKVSMSFQLNTLLGDTEVNAFV